MSDGWEEKHEKSSPVLPVWAAVRSWPRSSLAGGPYSSQPVREAGLGLALLYLTVLAPVNVTWGFATNQVPLGLI